ncbi:response regulator transcription factor [Iamia sp.]|uniref:response regulator transcription factor n=1 Tax=Iamia sp. TaxID=2722710 RepID=UPI002CF08C22|nr:response regulator transcription factor [Iamia sp.]HXH58676.1 response regulator transcription factor [Iamia sp.]
MSDSASPGAAMGAELPISVAAVNDYEIIVDGLAGMLGRFPDKANVCERIIVGEPIEHPPVDVALYDTYGRIGIAAQAIEQLRRHRHVRYVAMFTLDVTAALVDEARRAGATGFISKRLPAQAIIEALVRVASGEDVTAQGASTNPALDDLDWPGKDRGLTERESQVLVLVSEGLTNPQIGEALFVGHETIKTHLSRAYRRLGVRNRAEAVRLIFGTGAFERFRPAAEALDDT